MVKKTQFKIGRVVKKKIEEKQFLTLRLTGKVPTALLRQLKADINAAVQAALVESGSDSEV